MIIWTKIAENLRIFQLTQKQLKSLVKMITNINVFIALVVVILACSKF